MWKRSRIFSCGLALVLLLLSQSLLAQDSVADELQELINGLTTDLDNLEKANKTLEMENENLKNALERATNELAEVKSIWNEQENLWEEREKLWKSREITYSLLEESLTDYRNSQTKSEILNLLENLIWGLAGYGISEIKNDTIILFRQ